MARAAKPRSGVISVDNWFPDPHQLRQEAQEGPWEDFSAPQDGEVYRRVLPYHGRAVEARLARFLGRPPHIVAQGFRLNYGGEPPNASIHSDGYGWGRWAMVVGLDPNMEGKTGTAFWQHNATGLSVVSHTDAQLSQIAADWNNVEAFTQIGYAPLAFNRAIIYPTNVLHSRWPLEAYGDNPENGRLTMVSFFS